MVRLFPRNPRNLSLFSDQKFNAPLVLHQNLIGRAETEVFTRGRGPADLTKRGIT
jgi:hypothetical protein